jgi:hypothetical protein
MKRRPLAPFQASACSAFTAMKATLYRGRVPLTAPMIVAVIDPGTDGISPDAGGRGRDHSPGEPDDRARDSGRKPNFGGGNGSRRHVGEQANDQARDRARHAGQDRGHDDPSLKHRQATYPAGEGLHAPHCRSCDRELPPESDSAVSYGISGAFPGQDGGHHLYFDQEV